ncbi:hypothetical protein HED60_10565 [Planctomycetales bacterium ZRK34]|nr:hypothetical protein HED60_10565 [Planctomycetales bacterium ZRK34]
MQSKLHYAVLVVFCVMSVFSVARADTTVLFNDEFDVDPASNGWTEALGDANSRIELAGGVGTQLVSGGAAVIYQANSSSTNVASSITRTISTAGYNNIQLNLTAFQHPGSYEGPEYLLIEYDTGSGFTALLQDFDQYHAENDLDGEPLASTTGNTTPTPTAWLDLPIAAWNNAGLQIRITTASGFNDNFNSSSSEAYYLTSFSVRSVPTPAALPAGLSLLALVGLRRRR